MILPRDFFLRILTKTKLQVRNDMVQGIVSHYFKFLKIHMNVYIYISYIYICVCVCMYMYIYIYIYIYT